MKFLLNKQLKARIEAEETLVEAAYRSERLRVYRMRLQALIRSVSPLARDLADAHGIGLHGVVDLLRAYPDLQPCSQLQPDHRPRLHPSGTQVPGRPDRHPWMRASDLRISRAISRKGIVLDAQYGRGQLGYMVERGDLVAAGWLGACWFHTEGDRSQVVLHAAVPDTLIAAAVGRSIGEVVAHPIFEGRDYPIVRAVRVEDGPAVAFTFHTGRIAFELPWPELLRFEDPGCSTGRPSLECGTASR